MKFSFPDKFVNANSFVELCNIAQDYGFDGIEIIDAKKEKESHLDSIFHASMTVDAKRKLVNRHISIPVICYPEKINEKTDSNDIIKYIEYASIAKRRLKKKKTDVVDSTSANILSLIISKNYHGTIRSAVLVNINTDCKTNRILIEH